APFERVQDAVLVVVVGGVQVHVALQDVGLPLDGVRHRLGVDADLAAELAADAQRRAGLEVEDDPAVVVAHVDVGRRAGADPAPGVHAGADTAHRGAGPVLPPPAGEGLGARVDPGRADVQVALGPGAGERVDLVGDGHATEVPGQLGVA